MVNTDLTKINELINRAKVLLWMAFILAGLSLTLSIITYFLPYKTASRTLSASLVLFLSAFISWLLIGRGLIDAYHDLLFTSFKVDLADLGVLGNIDFQTLKTIRQFLLGPTPERFLGIFVKYFRIYAPFFYILVFNGFLNTIFYILTKVLEVNVPLQSFANALIVAIPVTVSIILGLSWWRGETTSSDPLCIIQLQDYLRDYLKGGRMWLFEYFIYILLSLALSFFLMPITLTPKTEVLRIFSASLILGTTFGLLAGAIHCLISGAAASDIAYLNCSYIKLLRSRLAERREQHPSAHGQGAR